MPDRSRRLPFGVVMSRIFGRTVVLSVVGGMGTGALFVLRYGPGAVVMVPLGGLAGVPLGLGAGLVISLLGAALLVPYRGPVVAMTVVSGLASCLVMGYLTLFLDGMAAAGRGEGPQADGPSLDWLVMSASMAAAVLSPWVVWWYVKRMETGTSSGVTEVTSLASPE
jgi:hypothetical protein